MNKRCVKCVMDESDKDIVFDNDGICNHCHSFKLRKENIIHHSADDETVFLNEIDKIKKLGKNRTYDCVVGVSGGVDSTYLVYLAKKHGLRCLLVHLDNGWDSEFAVDNIQRIVEYSGFDLYTHVIDWEEFKDIQKSFFHSDVIDLELPSDHAIFAIVYKIAIQHKIKVILNGENFATEAIMPEKWNWRKSDAKNIKSIHRRFGTGLKLRTFPFMSTFNRLIYKYLIGINSIPILNFVRYNKENVISVLENEIGWRRYPGKHYESIFTRFYQGFILPSKFNVDKRKAHLSTLINSGQISRNKAIEILREPTYDEQLQKQDFEYLCKKLDFKSNELDEYLSRNEKSHLMYGSDEWFFRILKRFREGKMATNVEK